ncbi:MAG: excinuclease ABC subunit C, partial [Spirochaetales bacterium]|nr:excinuclease ABC subunit C [Spirochaetales bacterium]
QAMRSKEASFRLLESVPGIGRKRSEALISQYGSLEAILQKSADSLASEASIPHTVAERLLRQLSL